jgi:hypothetical protein
VIQQLAPSPPSLSPHPNQVKRRYWPQLVITVLIPAFQQLTGINAIMWALATRRRRLRRRGACQ